MSKINKKINIPIYIINLKQDIEKKEHIKKLCAKFDLYPEFFDAVDGRLLPEKNINEVYSIEKAINTFKRELSRSEIGCALSHINIYKKMVNENISEAIVFEDDINFNKDLLEIFHRINNFPNNWNLILLGHHSCVRRDQETHYSFWGKKNLDNKYKIVRPTEDVCGTYGYILKLEAAKNLLSSLETIEKPIDHYTGVDEKLNLYIVDPAVVKINDFLSNTYHSMEDRTELQYTVQKKQKLINQKFMGMRRRYIELKRFFKKRRKYER